MPNRDILVDADCLVYLFAFRNQSTTKFRINGTGPEVLTSIGLVEKACRELDDFVAGLKAKLQGDRVFMALSDTESNFRKGVLPSYKANRADTAKPLLYHQLREHVRKGRGWFAAGSPSFEGDDALGILLSQDLKATEAICCSIDKDMRTVAGLHYNWDKPEAGIITITQAEADHFFFSQVLTGDIVDGYTGLPGCGPVTALKILGPPTDTFDTAAAWPLIVAAYEKKGLTEADAVTQARLARILTTPDGATNLWTPPTHDDNYSRPDADDALYEAFARNAETEQA